MEETTYHKFTSMIAKDFNVSLNIERVLKLPKDRLRIKHFTTSRADKVRIFDGQHEYPYMLINKRNDEVLSRGIELRYSGTKTLDEIVKETGVKLKSEGCKISEGGGWYSKGTKYYYKEFYIEV